MNDLSGSRIQAQAEGDESDTTSALHGGQGPGKIAVHVRIRARRRYSGSPRLGPRDQKMAKRAPKPPDPNEITPLIMQPPLASGKDSSMSRVQARQQGRGGGNLDARSMETVRGVSGRIMDFLSPRGSRSSPARAHGGKVYVYRPKPL